MGAAAVDTVLLVPAVSTRLIMYHVNCDVVNNSQATKTIAFKQT